MKKMNIREKGRTKCLEFEPFLALQKNRRKIITPHILVHPNAKTEFPKKKVSSFARWYKNFFKIKIQISNTIFMKWEYLFFSIVQFINPVWD